MTMTEVEIRMAGLAMPNVRARDLPLFEEFYKAILKESNYV